MEYLRTFKSLIKNLKLWLTTSKSDKYHVFITGAPRSGSTLIKTILTAHPKFASCDYESTGVFKLRNIYEYKNGEIENGWISISGDSCNNIVQFYDRLAANLLQYYKGEYFVDKIWPTKYRLKFVENKFPNARWIHIVRDGRDSYCSALNHPNVPQSETVIEYSKYWKLCNELIEQEVSYKKKFMVRYEDLTLNPTLEIRKMMDFLKVSFDPAQLSPAQSKRIPSIHKRNYHHKLAKPIDTASVRRFEEDMNEQEQEKFIEVSGDTLKRYGYL